MWKFMVRPIVSCYNSRNQFDGNGVHMKDIKKFQKKFKKKLSKRPLTPELIRALQRQESAMAWKGWA
jgi:hypothetical protein